MLVLVHGGLAEPMDAERFWHATGVTAALSARRIAWCAPDRPAFATSWATEVDTLTDRLTGLPAPHTLIGGSNGCSVVVRFALDHPGEVSALLLAWPATAGDAAIDRAAVDRLEAAGLASAQITDLLTGDTLRGVDDDELRSLAMPIWLLPSNPPNPAHASVTIGRLALLLRDVRMLEGTPEPPRPDFDAEHFVASIEPVLVATAR